MAGMVFAQPTTSRDGYRCHNSLTLKPFQQTMGMAGVPVTGADGIRNRGTPTHPTTFFLVFLCCQYTHYQNKKDLSSNSKSHASSGMTSSGSLERKECGTFSSMQIPGMPTGGGATEPLSLKHFSLPFSSSSIPTGRSVITEWKSEVDSGTKLQKFYIRACGLRDPNSPPGIDLDSPWSAIIPILWSKFSGSGVLPH